MTDLSITELSEKEMQTVSGGWGPINIQQPQLNFNIGQPQINFNLNFGVIVVAGNKISAPLTINFKQLH